MRKLFCLLIVAFLGFSTFAGAVTRNQRKGGVIIGFNPSTPNGGTSTLNLNAAATWGQYGFVPTATKTLSKLKFYVSAVTGTVASMLVEIVRDIAGSATAAVTVQDLGDTVTLTAHPFANGDMVRFNATANGITADTTYWVCNKAANTFTLDTVGAGCANALAITSDGSNSVRGIIDLTTTFTSLPAGELWVEATTFTGSLVGGTQHRLLIRNTTGTPASNYPVLQYGASATWVAGETTGSSTGLQGWFKTATTDSGATWTAASYGGVVPIRLEYTDGTFEGMPISNFTTEANTVYSNREVGPVFTLPANAIYNVKCAGLFLSTKTGTPTGSARIRLYNGVTPLATSVDQWTAAQSSTGYYIGCFSSDQVLTGGSTIRVVLSETTQADTNANAYRIYQYTVENNADSKALMPFNGTLKQTYTLDSTASPVVFTDTDTEIIPFMLILDTEGEFTAPASGGSGATPSIHF